MEEGISFNGKNTYVLIKTKYKYVTNNFSIAFWIKVNGSFQNGVKHH